MNTENNKRGLAYKEKLKKGYLQLLEKGVEIDQISVKSICETAGVNRSTFYSHYAIPGDILSEIEEETLQSVTGYMQKISWQNFDYLTVFLEYIKEHDDVFRILFLYAKDRFFLDRLIQNSLYHFENVKAYLKDEKNYPHIKAYIIAGSKEVINAWIQGNYSESAENIKSFLYTISEAAIRAFTK